MFSFLIDAALEPIRGLNLDEVKDLDEAKLRQISMDDFQQSLKRVKKSVSPSSLRDFEKWSMEYAGV